MDILDFLRLVITSTQPGWLAIGASYPNGTGWRNYWHAWPAEADSAVALMQGLIDEGMNVYFSPHLFTDKKAIKANVIPTCTMYVDMDEADPHSVPLPPTVLLKSSNERHQAYWLLNEDIAPEDLEELNRRLAWGIEKADHSVWSLGHMMRVPTSLNYKYTPPEKVRVIQKHPKRRYNSADFGCFEPLELTAPKAILVTDEWIEKALKVPAGHANVTDFWDSVRTHMARGIELYFYNEAPDRSGALWRLMRECFRSGLTEQETFLIAYHSKNNKFKDLRYGGLQALAKDVMRAKLQHDSGQDGLRDIINTARKAVNKPLNERRQQVAKDCLNTLLNRGRFIHARGGTLWYILESEGRPIAITRMSSQLNVILERMFGLNATEPDQQYVVAHLINYATALPPTGEVASLSYYMPETETLFLHMGNKDILRITADEITTVSNGTEDVIFLWNSDITMIPDIDSPYDTDDTWYDAIFGPLNNLTGDGIDVPQAMALLRAWFITVLMRNAIASRPILAVFGQPGAGKSTLFKKVYALMYGKFKAVSGVGTAQEFDAAMSVDPFLALDNVDTFAAWLPDRIARAAGVSELTRRKLYTDTDTVTLRLQGMLGITAHNPKFGREDVLDRFILLTLERRQTYEAETELVDNVNINRNKYWGQIARDMQRVLGEPNPPREQVAQFRVQDFSRIGQRIANALGFGDVFRSAIQHMVDQQKGFVLDEDSILVDIIDKYVKGAHKAKSDEWCTPAKLWGIFDVIGGLDKSFSKQYGNSIKLGRKLWAMQDALKQRFIVEWEFDSRQKTRVWRFKAKDTGTNDGQAQ